MPQRSRLEFLPSTAHTIHQQAPQSQSSSRPLLMSFRSFTLASSHWRSFLFRLLVFKFSSNIFWRRASSLVMWEGSGGRGKFDPLGNPNRSKSYSGRRHSTRSVGARASQPKGSQSCQPNGSKVPADNPVNSMYCNYLFPLSASIFRFEYYLFTSQSADGTTFFL